MVQLVMKSQNINDALENAVRKHSDIPSHSMIFTDAPCSSLKSLSQISYNKLLRGLELQLLE